MHCELQVEFRAYHCREGSICEALRQCTQDLVTKLRQTAPMALSKLLLPLDSAERVKALAKLELRAPCIATDLLSTVSG